MDRRWRSGAWLAAGIAIGACVAPLLVPRAGAEPGGAAERFTCRSFSYDPRKTPQLDTRDVATELGRWVVEQEDRGWQVESVRPEVVIKATGTAEAWAHVCLVPVR